MRILVYGAGAIGCFLGGHLSAAGHDVTLLGRESLAAALAQRNLQLNLVDGPVKVKNVKAVSSLDAALEHGPFDWIAFTMKAYDTTPAIYELQQHPDLNPVIASFQNGIGNEESIKAAFGDDRVVGGTTTTPVSIGQTGVVIEEKRRGVAIASDSPYAKLVQEALESTKLNIQTVPSTPSLKWSKLLLNIIANAIPAILDRTSIEVVKDRRFFALEMAVLREAISVSRYLNVKITNLLGVPAGLMAAAVRSMPNFMLRPLLADRVIKGRGQKPPSLLLALRSSSKRTEAAWLNGGVAQAAQTKARLAPLNHAIALTLSDIVAGRESWDSYRRDPTRLLSVAAAARGIDNWWYGE